MKTLFNNNLYPITSHFAFIKANIDDIKNRFIEWQNPLVSEANNKLQIKHLKLNLKDTLLSLCPLTSVEKRRYLLIPTSSEWVCFLDNGHTGTDRTAPEVISKSLNCESAFIVYDDFTKSTLLDVFKIVNGNVDLVRSIYAIKDSKWEFEIYGDIQDFENPEYYKARQIKDRFNMNILNEYLEKLDIHVFDENFYNSTESIFFEKKGKMFDLTQELSLKQAQNFFK